MHRLSTGKTCGAQRKGKAGRREGEGRREGSGRKAEEGGGGGGRREGAWGKGAGRGGAAERPGGTGNTGKGRQGQKEETGRGACRGGEGNSRRPHYRRSGTGEKREERRGESGKKNTRNKGRKKKRRPRERATSGRRSPPARSGVGVGGGLCARRRPAAPRSGREGAVQAHPVSGCSGREAATAALPARHGCRADWCNVCCCGVEGGFEDRTKPFYSWLMFRTNAGTDARLVPCCFLPARYSAPGSARSGSGSPGRPYPPTNRHIISNYRTLYFSVR